jgi:hypothetical protein
VYLISFNFDFRAVNYVLSYLLYLSSNDGCKNNLNIKKFPVFLYILTNTGSCKCSIFRSINPSSCPFTCLITRCITTITRQILVREEGNATHPEYLCSPGPGFLWTSCSIGVWFLVEHCLSFCFLSADHCIVCPLIYCFWLPTLVFSNSYWTNLWIMLLRRSKYL